MAEAIELRRFVYAVESTATPLSIEAAYNIPPGWSGNERVSVTIVHGSDSELDLIVWAHCQALWSFDVVEVLMRRGHTDSEIVTVTDLGVG